MYICLVRVYSITSGFGRSTMSVMYLSVSVTMLLFLGNGDDYPSLNDISFHNCSHHAGVFTRIIPQSSLPCNLWLHSCTFSKRPIIFSRKLISGNLTANKCQRIYCLFGFRMYIFLDLTNTAIESFTEHLQKPMPIPVFIF